MKLSKLFLSLVFVGVLMCGITACNSDEDADVIYTSYANTMVKTFSMSADIDVLTNLAYRYFTIDLVNGLIYNPDSFPYEPIYRHLCPISHSLRRQVSKLPFSIRATVRC